MAKKKTITVAGKDITLAVDGAMALVYNSEFQRDYIADVLTVGATMAALNKPDADPELYKTLDTSVLYNLVYVLAKNADDTIPSPIDWYRTFDEFPIIDVFMQIDDLLMSNMHTSVKKVKKK